MTAPRTTISLPARPSNAASSVLLLAGVLVLACRASGQEPGGILDSFSLTVDSSRQWKLPDRLNEISGLALTQDQRLFAIADEAAIVYELDYSEGRLVKAFALGNPVVRGDFEGIAWLGGRVYLVESGGTIFAAPEGGDGERVAYEIFETGLGEQCEIEGLAQDTGAGSLLLACKALRQGSILKGLAIFTWSPESGRVVEDAQIDLPERQIGEALRRNRINPSGITIDPESDNLLLVAARQRSLIELTRDGGFVDARPLLLVSRHRQSEGIELTADGKLLIADEGGSHKARLALYLRDDQGAE